MSKNGTLAMGRAPANATLPQRIEAWLNRCVATEDGCLVWQGGQAGEGYARVSFPPDASGVVRTVALHRVMYEHFVGPIAAGLQLDHLCRNRVCINPVHLEPVTAAENSRRSRKAKLNWENVREIRASTEGRVALAARFGVTPHAIDAVRRGDRWAA